MSAGDIGKTEVAVQQQRTPSTPHNPWANQQTNDPMAWILTHVLTCELPEDPSDYNQLFELMLKVAGTNPNCTENVIKKWKRDIIDIDDRAHSEGRGAITQAKCRKLLFEMRAYMSRGDNAHVGVSAVTAAHTFRHHDEITQRIPQQPAEKGFLSGLNPFKRG